MRKVFLCLIFFIIQIPFDYAQQRKIDSLKSVLKRTKQDTERVNILNALSRELIRNNLDSAANVYAKNALDISEKIDFIKGKATVYRLKGFISEDQSNYAEALKNHLQSLEMAEEINDKEQISYAYTNIGNIYLTQGNYPEALKYQLQSLKIDEKAGNKMGMGITYGNIGLIYYYQGNYAEALKNQQQSLEMNKASGNKNGIAMAYGNAGIAYQALKNYSAALESQLQSFRMAEEIGDKGGQANTLANIASIYSDEGNYQKALENSLLSLKTAKEIGDNRTIGFVYVNAGNMFVKQKKYAEAIEYLDSALSIAKETGIKEIAVHAYTGLTKADSANGNYVKAFTDYKMYVLYQDSLKNEENTKKLVSEQMTYEFDKKQAEEKAEQDKKDAIAKSDKRKQEIITASIGLGLLLVLIFSGLLFSRFRVTQKQKRIIEEQKAIVEEKNKDILDSITYAKRLQDAILPPLGVIKKYLPESFVLYKPKDIVAGDFYWMEQTESALFIAAADCTGHGVPGAMVSVVCSNALNRTVKEFHITETGKILDKVRELVIETFEKSESEVKDGMDISLAAISRQSSADGIEIQWSGAYNPLWYMQNNELKELTADKQPIGKQENPKPFKTHVVDLQTGDMLYLFTDGYADQFGGPKGKKFKYKQLQEKLLTISSLDMDKQKAILDETIETWKSDIEQTDDVCIIGIKV
jgi:tetratricopeptide (TPR) repeat protein